MIDMSPFPVIPDDYSVKPRSVVREWVSALPYKQQTVLLVSLRGYDGVGKGDPSKPLVKAMRATLLQNAVPTAPDFMQTSANLCTARAFFENVHHYPVHWVMHFAHAAQIVGYKHPDPVMRRWWHQIYLYVIEVLHVTPETEEQMDARLSDGW